MVRFDEPTSAAVSQSPAAPVLASTTMAPYFFTPELASARAMVQAMPTSAIPLVGKAAVGFTPSTLWEACAVTAEWVRVALLFAPSLMVAAGLVGSASLSASMAMPSASASPATTV